MAKRKTYRKRSRNRRRTRRRKKQRRRKTRKRRRRRRRRGGASRSPLPPPPLDIFSPTPYEGIKRTIIHNRKVHLGILEKSLGKYHKKTEKYRSATNINDQVIEHARTMLKQRITHPPGLTEQQFRQVKKEALASSISVKPWSNPFGVRPPVVWGAEYASGKKRRAAGAKYVASIPPRPRLRRS